MASAVGGVQSGELAQSVEFGSVTVHGSGAFPELMVFIKEVNTYEGRALLAWLMTCQATGRRVELWLPDDILGALRDLRGGSLLMSAVLSGLHGGVLLRHDGEYEWSVSSHT